MAPASSERSFQVEPGRPGDIFFFLTEMVSGASHGHFGERFCSLTMTEREFGTRCAKAILGYIFPFWHTVATQQFVVARYQREIVGAALSYTDTHQLDSPLTCIEVVVVDERWRRQGIGQALVAYFQKRTPPNGRLECFCTPESRVMARLIKHLGFKRTHKAAKFTVEGQKLEVPERWEWRALRAHQPLDTVRRKSDTAASP